MKIMDKKNRIVLSAAAAILLSTHAAAIDYYGISMPVRAILCGVWDGFKIIAAALATLVFVVAAVQWIYNAGDPGKRKAARDIMVHVIVGLIVVGISNELANAISDTFKGC